MSFLKKRTFWIGLALFITVEAGLIYVVTQQSLRQAANQPQEAMVNDVARDLGQGRKPEDLVPGYIDMERNMAPFIIIYDQFGKVVTGNGHLDNEIPQVPIGVLSAAKDHKINRVTWEPKQGVRIASVSVQGGDYYVLGGRSLKDTEHQISWISKTLVGLWVLSMIIVIAGYNVVRRKPNHPLDAIDRT
ncbi:MAG: hypothetical protein ACR2FM_00990 [Candidatus Saccharimonadales bacterium]